MGKPDIFIETAFLATKNKLENKVLLCNRIESQDVSGDFLFYLIEVTLPNQETIAKKIIQILSNDAKTTIGLSPENFEKALALVNETLKRSSETQNNSWIGNLNAVIGLVQQDEIFLSQTGNVVGYIFRKSKISSLTEQNDETPHPSRTFTEIVSGSISVGDQLIFGNNDLFNHISIDRLRNLIKLDNARAEILDLKQYLQKTHAIDSNAVVIQIVEEKNEENNLEEMLFLDEAEETAFSNFTKDLRPRLKKAKQTIRKYWKQLSEKTSDTKSAFKSKWDETYGPKTKKLFEAGNSKIKTVIKTGSDKISDYQKSAKAPKIKANQYQPQETLPKSNSKLTDLLQSAIRSIRQVFSQIDFGSRKTQRIILIILVSLVLIVSYVKIKNNSVKNSEAAKQIETISAYDQAQKLFTSAKQDLSLGKITTLDKFYEALSLAEKSKENQANVEKAKTLITQINTFLDSKTKTTRFTTTSSFALADKISQISLVGSEVYGATPEGKIYTADTREKTVSLVGSVGKENGNIVAMVYSNATNSIMISTDSKKLLSLDLTSNVIGKLTNADTNSDWKTTKTFSVYSTNIYAVDSTSVGIWKYTKPDTTYSKASAYVDTKKVSLANVIDLAIDGNIFALNNDGTAIKLVKGALDATFTIKNIPAPKTKIDGPSKIYTSEDTTSVFIFDKTNNRVVRLDKTGEFTNQYVFDGVTIDSFVVNPKLQKIWALSSGKIYEGNL